MVGAPSLRKIPVTIITGFLGAGKTTLLTYLLKHAPGYRIAVIVNEFGSAGVDGDTIRGCGAKNCGQDDVVELANGCLCCTVADDFIPAMSKLLDRDDTPDHIVIETSGLALPKPLLKAFRWPDIAHRVSVDGVIAVIDGPAVAQGLFAQDPQAVAQQRAEDMSVDHENPLSEVFSDQVQCADLIIINKADLLTQKQLDDVAHIIEGQSRRSVRMIRASEGRVSPDILLGIDAQAEHDLASRPSHHDGAEDHEHDDFVSFALSVEEQEGGQYMVKRIKAALKQFKILRLKGFIKVAGKTMILAVQAVGKHLRYAYEAPAGGMLPQKGQLVVIGEKGLDAQAIAHFLGGRLGAG